MPRWSSVARRAWPGRPPSGWRERAREVAILDLPTSAGDEVAEELGAAFHPCDVIDAEARGRAARPRVEMLGCLHIAVNTAGGGYRDAHARRKNGPHPLDEFRRVIELNLSPRSTSTGCRPGT